MLDPNLLRNEINIVAEKLARKNFTLDINLWKHREMQRKSLQVETEKICAERNIQSKLIGFAKYRGDNIDSIQNKVIHLGEQLDEAKTKLQAIKQEILDDALSLPNMPSDQVPDGKDEKDNREIYRWGEPRKYNFPIRDHVDLGESLGELSFSAAVKIVGSRFFVMQGQIARMYRVLSQFMLDIHTERHGYKEYYLPYLVNYTSLYSTGQLPRFSEDLFHIDSSSISCPYALIPTAEVPLTNLIRGDILREDQLPIKMTSHTPCFRSEAGSYGRDTRGMMRTHQFDKVEMVQMVKPADSMQALEEMTDHAETVLKLLNLPYRKLLLCAGDTGFASCKTYDLEVWMPGQNVYREVSSCSNMSDFQARRLQARYRNKENKKPVLLHTLNGSGLAVGRTLVAILENYQLVDGRIEIPAVLRSYMKDLKYIG